MTSSAAAPRAAPSAEGVADYWRPRCVFSFGPHRVVVDGFVYGMEPLVIAKRATAAAATTINGTTRAAASAAREADEGLRRLATSSSSASSFTQLLPTPVVDGSPKTAYFLSHFHSDHYMGINAGFDRGNIFCTRITARLLEHSLGVRGRYLRPVDLGVMYRIDTTTGDLVDERRGSREPWSVDFMLVDANHCPGAAMVVLWSNAEGISVHTGDFRFALKAQGKSPRVDGDADDRPRAAAQHALPKLVTVPPPRIGHGLGRRNPPRRGAGNTSTGGSTAQATLSRMPSMRAAFDDGEHPLRPFRNKVDRLFLDNTFCDPKYVFPSADDSVELAVARVKAGVPATATRRLFAFGTYTIGKEKFAFGCRAKLQMLDPALIACEEEQQRRRVLPIFATPSKVKLLSRCELAEPHHVLPLPDGDAAVVVDPEAASSTTTSGGDRVPTRTVVYSADALIAAAGSGGTVFVFAPLDAFGYKRLQEDGNALYLGADHDGGDEGVGAATNTIGEVVAGPRRTEYKIDLRGFDVVVGFEPTGWAAGTASDKRERQIGRLTKVSVPYSEHCSWNELLDFVAYLNPKTVVPTVSVAQYKAHESLFVERAAQLKPRMGGTMPITSFFKRHRTDGGGEGGGGTLGHAVDASAATASPSTGVARGCDDSPRQPWPDDSVVEVSTVDDDLCVVDPSIGGPPVIDVDDSD